MDGLVHVSQVTNDYMTFDKKTGMLVGKASKKVLKKGDSVRAKIATVSLKDSIPASKIALTMRPEGMGAEGKVGKDGKADKAKKAVKEERIA
jgi:DNA-directed RNA polymerase subunit E'